MSNQHPDQSVHANASPAPAAMRELTTVELSAVVGGPIIRNGDAIVTVPPAATGG